MEKNLDHLTSEEIETLMQRYYAGESVSKLTKEYGISVRSSNLYKKYIPSHGHQSISHLFLLKTKCF